MPFGRQLAHTLRQAFGKPYVHILFGARQVGKSTLLRELLPDVALWIDLSDPGQRARYLAQPETFIEECLALPTRRAASIIVVDEAQAVPALFDAVQHLYDRNRNRFRFILSGSSARKLRLAGANLLPGRSFVHRLYPLILSERPAPKQADRTTAETNVVGLRRSVEAKLFPSAGLIERLAWGDLPGIALAARPDREPLLRAYATVYLEEELRREALIKDWGSFSRFLRLAALEAGQMVNYAKIAKDAGTSAPTVRSHYQLLEDMFMGFQVHAYSGSPRKHVLSTPRFFFFDLGVRHAAAGLANNEDTVLASPGSVFEQWVGLELWKRLQYLGRGSLRYFRTKAGSEVDFIIDRGDSLTPIEVKWTENPSCHDIRHLSLFLDEHKRKAKMGYLVCRCARPRRLADNIIALPWWGF